ncbi:MAE_28990/MAE_18760 family HEPN-like nuclease [Burkholderia gladioli]|uniref:MAE_28990/MAE_18760 family HEPN-like nuclease n=1 Tax=Burkholderia gladioli TaxID=28095 RepID=UPI00163E6DF3|nr:MAE_28990/MAE_18760 family HEPN-like nuclease [Burkholderia gladioli]
MADIHTLVQLQDALDKEMGWRRKEILAFGVASKKNGPDAAFFIRAGVALLYAHWEGFIKSASEHYLNYVQHQGHTYRELKSCFAIFGLKGKLHLLSVSRKSLANIEAFDFILSELGRHANLNMSMAIDTESNLTSKVFANIAASLDIDTSNYETRFNLIDESLVGLRNKVAHGEYLRLGGREFGELVGEMLEIMGWYKTDLMNAAAQAKYLLENAAELR